MVKGNVFERDPVLSKGYGYRKNAWLLFQVSACGMLVLLFGNFWADLALLAVNVYGWSNVFRYRKWLKDNRTYIMRKGYEAK